MGRATVHAYVRGVGRLCVCARVCVRVCMCVRVCVRVCGVRVYVHV